jgi:biopolymer transport protein TolQ
MAVPITEIEPAAGPSLSLLSLLGQADIVVKLIMLLLLSLSIISWTIWFAKGRQIKQLKKQADKFEDTYTKDAGATLAKKMGGKSPEHAGHPMSAIYLTGMMAIEQTRTTDALFFERLRRQLGTLLTRELEMLGGGLSMLATIGSTAPFIGLFGTVWGVMNAFIGIGATKNTSLAVVAPGIAEALFVTAMGLFAAIPATIAYNRLSSKLNAYAVQLETFSEDFLVESEIKSGKK